MPAILSNPVVRELIKVVAIKIVEEAAKAIIKGLDSDDKSYETQS